MDCCEVCTEPFSPPPSAGQRLVLGRCNHVLCLACCTRTTEGLLAEYAVAGGVHTKGYITPHLARNALPGILCPLCCPSLVSRQAFAASHWKQCASLRANARRGVSWRVFVDPSAPWSASFYDGSNDLIFRLASPEAAATPPAQATPASPGVCTLDVPHPQELDITLGEDGFHVWTLGGGGGAAGAAASGAAAASARQPAPLAAFAAPLAPAPRRVSFSGTAQLGSIPSPPTCLPGFLSSTAMARMTEFATTPAAAKLGVHPFHPTGLQCAEQALLLLNLFLTSLAREHSNAPYGGALVGSMAGSRGGGSGSSSGSGSGSGGGGTPGGIAVPVSPNLAAPLVCPHDNCGAVLSVDLPPFHDAEQRGVHLSCTQCQRGLCGSCGLPWSAPGNLPISHAGVSCAAHAQLYSRLSLGDVTGEEGLTEDAKGAVKRCPMPQCGALVYRYRG